MKKIQVEIRASEGGNDSKLLVEDLMNIYIKSCKNKGFAWIINESSPGFASIWIEGDNPDKYFINESGSHCFVRVPPTEKYNRTQTSFVTVAIMNLENKTEFKLNKDDISKTYTCSRGKGGQNVNRIHSCVVLTHIPTGIQVRCEETRNQAKNEELAYERMYEKLKVIEDNKFNNKVKNHRNDQIGESGRGTKRRTYRIKDDMVTDHITGKTCRWKDIIKGKLELIK